MQFLVIAVFAYAIRALFFLPCLYTQLPPAAIGTAPLAPHTALSQQLDHQASPHSNTTPQLQAKISAATMGRSQRQPPAPLSVVVPKPLQSDLKPGSGRHPHPPSSANTKLKHKVITQTSGCGHLVMWPN